MSKREISNTFGGERSKETKEDKYQYQLRTKATIARQNLWKNIGLRYHYRILAIDPRHP